MDKKTPQREDGFRGAIPLLRKFIEHPFWNENRKFSRAEAWIDLLFMARFSEKDEQILDRGEVITIRYGQILTSTVTLSVKWNRSRTWVQQILRILEKNESIKYIRMDSRRTILEIVKMGYVKSLLKQKDSRLDSRLDSRKTYNNKDNKDNKEIQVFIDFFNEAFKTSFKITDGRNKKLLLRMRMFSLEQICSAAKNLSQSNFHTGENDRGWKADPDFLLRSDEQIDKWLQQPTKQKGVLDNYQLQN